MFRLENEYLDMICTPAGGEMLSIKDKTSGREMLYQGDEGWSGRNPSLFPIVGNTWTKTYEIEGKTYAMKNHGLIRYAALEGEQSEDKVTFRLTSDEETRAQYPFDFVYEISYRLEGKKVLISYRIENTGSKDMPFTFGLHPAFRIDGDFSDWTLKLSPAGTASQIHFNKGSVSQEEVCLDTWQLSRKDIEEEATLVYADVKADKAVLLKGGKPVLAMHFKGFPYLAIWTHDVPSHFLCIEPWYGHADFEPVDVPFEKRAGMMELAPGEVWTTGYEIEVL